MRAAAREFIETIALAVFLVLLLQSTVANYRVEGPSMDPYLHDFDRVLVNKAVYTEIDAARVAQFVPGLEVGNGETWHPFHPPQRGDVIVFQFPGDPRQNFVKRVIGLPGDMVRIEHGTVYVNGEALEEPYVHHESSESIRPRQVEPNSYYVLGDNRRQSDDSRRWGTVPKDHIIGKAWVTYWPVDSIATLFANGVNVLGVVLPPISR